MTVSIVPGIENNRAVYQVLEHLDGYGPVWTEIGDEEANEPTIIRWIIEGQFQASVARHCIQHRGRLVA